MQHTRREKDFSSLGQEIGLKYDAIDLVIKSTKSFIRSIDDCFFLPQRAKAKRSVHGRKADNEESRSMSGGRKERKIIRNTITSRSGSHC